VEHQLPLVQVKLVARRRLSEAYFGTLLYITKNLELHCNFNCKRILQDIFSAVWLIGLRYCGLEWYCTLNEHTLFTAME